MKSVKLVLVLTVLATMFTQGAMAAKQRYECECYITAEDGYEFRPHRHWTNICGTAASLSEAEKGAEQMCWSEVDDAKSWADSLNQFRTYDTQVKNCQPVKKCDNN